MVYFTKSKQNFTFMQKMIENERYLKSCKNSELRLKNS